MQTGFRPASRRTDTDMVWLAVYASVKEEQVSWWKCQ